jgi:AraC family transcriptional regulator
MQLDQPAPACRDSTMASRRQAVERVIKAMRERLDEPLSLHDLARIAYISPFHFNRVFQQVTGLTPTRFLYAMRLHAAKHLLLTTPLSVTDVCFEVGYNSLGTFTTRFTQLVGLSPCGLRRFAEKMTPNSFELLCEHYSDAQGIAAPPPFISGRVVSPRPFEGLIFIGLFPLHIPQSLPAGGTLLDTPGPYSLGRVPDGIYHLLAAALPKSKQTLTYLLPDSEAMLVGTGLVFVQDGRASGVTDITMRPMSVTDPPLLVSLPSLLTRAPDGKSYRPTSRLM